MGRPYTCTVCNEERSTTAQRGRLPKVCPGCRGVTGYVLQGERTELDSLPDVAPAVLHPAGPVHDFDDGPPPDPPPARTPFNSTPATAPVADVPADAGPVERKLHVDLAMLQAQGSPVADTLAEMALMLARSADATSAAGGSVRELIAATKELRAILDDITKTSDGGGNRGREDAGEGPFGAMRPEVVNA